MKKLSFIFAMMFAASMAMAQNTSLLVQKGSTNDALVKQIGIGNNDKVHQYGNNDDATVKQIGSYNIAVADQLLGDRNTATVLQDNNSNQAYLVQGMNTGYFSADGVTTLDIAAYDNIGSITQGSGVRNYSELHQMGNNNNGSVVTSGNDNFAYIYQGWAGSWWGEPSILGNNNTASIKQTWNNNWGGIWQDGNNNGANLLQDGTSNMGRISQGYNYTGITGVAYTPYVQYNQANVTQIGIGNYLRLFQLGDANLFKLKQSGDYNTVGGRTTIGDYRKNFFQQYGNSNKFTGVYRSGNDLWFDINADAEQSNGATLSETSYQKGDLNRIGLVQGQGDVALIQQDGYNNEAVLWQHGGGQNAEIMQTGSTNTANVLQQNQ